MNAAAAAASAMEAREQLHQAFSDEDLDKFKQILRENPRLDLNEPVYGNGDECPLLYYIGSIESIAESSPDFVKAILNHPNVDVNARTQSEETTLMDTESPEIVELLLAVPTIDVNAKNRYGITALIMAAEYHMDWKVKRLLQVPGIDVNAKTTEEGGNNALMLASLPPTLRDNSNRSLEDNLKSAKELEEDYHYTVKALLGTNIDVNATNNDGDTALYKMCPNTSIMGITNTIIPDRFLDEIIPLRMATFKLFMHDRRVVVDQKTAKCIQASKNDRYHEGNRRIAIAMEDAIAARNLPGRNIPKGTLNAVMMDEIVNGNDMVNFHDESKFKRYYRKNTYNSLSGTEGRKKNPFTPDRIIHESDVVRYRANVKGGGSRRGSRRGSPKTKKTRHGRRGCRSTTRKTRRATA